MLWFVIDFVELEDLATYLPCLLSFQYLIEVTADLVVGMLITVQVDVDGCIQVHEHDCFVIDSIIEEFAEFEMVSWIVVEEVDLVLQNFEGSSFHQTLTLIHQYLNLPKDFVAVVMMLIDLLLIEAVL